MIGRVVATLLILIFGASTISAHGIGVEAKLKGSTVHIEAYFDDDTPASDATVTLTDSEGKTVVRGKTDGKGAWTFPAPTAGNYRVIVNAGDGHQAKTTIAIPAITPSADDPAGERAVSEGPSRQEFTRVPWEKIALGLGGIAAVTTLLWWRSRGTDSASAPPNSNPNPM
jgi:nickel transport protein